MAGWTNPLLSWKLEVQKGAIKRHSIWTALGERESMGTTASGEDVWRGNELSPAPTSHTTIPTPAAAGELMTIVSESQADNGTSATGALTVDIHYLDPDGDQQEITVTLNGTTPVNIPVILMRFINDSHVETVGSGGVAAGHIKIYKTGTVGLVYNMIAAGGNKSLVPHRMVPRAHTLYLQGWSCSEAQGKRAAFRIRSTDHHGGLYPGVFIFKGTSYITITASGELTLGDTIPALSIVKVSAWAIANGAEGSCSWWGVLVDDRIA